MELDWSLRFPQDRLTIFEDALKSFKSTLRGLCNQTWKHTRRDEKSMPGMLNESEITYLDVFIFATESRPVLHSTWPFLKYLKSSTHHLLVVLSSKMDWALQPHPIIYLRHVTYAGLTLSFLVTFMNLTSAKFLKIRLYMMQSVKADPRGRAV